MGRQRQCAAGVMSTSGSDAMRRGFMVCFEGIDGAGKRTQTRLLAQKLRKEGMGVSTYSYPDYASEYGKIIRRYLSGNMKLGRKEHFLLFLMDILKDTERIRKDLERGKIVVTDRYLYTALAYICPSGLDYMEAKKFVGLFGLENPSLVFYLDMPVEMTAARKLRHKKSLDKFEKNIGFLRDVKEVYGRMIKERYGTRWIRIDATVPIANVSGSIFKEMAKHTD